jgi:hypothetical protein
VREQEEDCPEGGIKGRQPDAKQRPAEQRRLRAACAPRFRVCTIPGAGHYLRGHLPVQRDPPRIGGRIFEASLRE